MKTCTKCKLQRDESVFISKAGRELKTCNRCRNLDKSYNQNRSRFINKTIKKGNKQLPKNEPFIKITSTETDNKQSPKNEPFFNIRSTDIDNKQSPNNNFIENQQSDFNEPYLSDGSITNSSINDNSISEYTITKHEKIINEPFNINSSSESNTIHKQQDNQQQDKQPQDNKIDKRKLPTKQEVLDYLATTPEDVRHKMKKIKNDYIRLTNGGTSENYSIHNHMEIVKNYDMLKHVIRHYPTDISGRGKDQAHNKSIDEIYKYIREETKRDNIFDSKTDVLKVFQGMVKEANNCLRRIDIYDKQFKPIN